LKVVLVSDYYAPRVGGGVERVVEEIAVRLVRFGHEVRVITLDIDGHPAYESREGVEIVRVPALHLDAILGTSVAVCPSFRLDRFLGDADVIHVHNLFFALTLSTFLSRPKAPIVTTLHIGSLAEIPSFPGLLARGYERMVGQRIMKRSAAVTAVSRAVANHAASLDRSLQVHVIPNTVDAKRFAPSAIGENGGCRRVLYLGRLVRNKGPQILVNSIPQVLAEVDDVEFRFVGDGPLRAWIARRLARLGLTRFARVQGWAKDPAPVLRSSSIMVRPSLTEGMSLALLEAMACGRVVVATRVGGTPEIVRDGETGILVEPGSTASLADGLLRVLTDENLSHAIRQRALEWTACLPSWEDITRSYLSVYEEVAS